ncbi:hypothetical protein V1527DRAFT_522331 [Lipomyces starkeyi]
MGLQAINAGTLLRYASHVNKKCGYSNIWGFIDDTFRSTTQSGLEYILKNMDSLFPDGHHLYIIREPAYSEGYIPPSRLVLTPEKSELNVRMSGVRIAVEQLFGLVLNKWAYNGYKYVLRQQSTAVAAHYMVSVLLTNIPTCLEEGNEVSQSFGCTPPSLDDYLKLD